MNKRTAQQYDVLLSEIAAKPQMGFRPEIIWSKAEKLGMSQQELMAAVATFKVDGFVESIKHPSAPDADFGVFNISNKGVRFITHDGGYQQRRTRERYEEDNIKLQWYHHWAWFIAFVVSLMGNIYLLFNQ